MLSVTSAVGQVAVLFVFLFTVWTQTQRLVFEVSLFLLCQEEAFVSHLGNKVDHADAVIDVTTVKQTNVLVGNQHVLLADRANTFSIRVFLLSLVTLRGKVIAAYTHGFGFAGVEGILKLRQANCLNVFLVIM